MKIQHPIMDIIYSDETNNLLQHLEEMLEKYVDKFKQHLIEEDPCIRHSELSILINTDLQRKEILDAIKKVKEHAIPVKVIIS